MLLFFHKKGLSQFQLITITIQYGFQRGNNCKMASFMLQESRDYYIEHGSPLHACYLEAQAAFDNVWLTGLVYKLHTMGIRGKCLRIVNSTFRGTRSQVLHDGGLSKPFNIEQGTRQGSICAPF